MFNIKIRRNTKLCSILNMFLTESPSSTHPSFQFSRFTLPLRFLCRQKVRKNHNLSCWNSSSIETFPNEWRLLIITNLTCTFTKWCTHRARSSWKPTSYSESWGESFQMSKAPQCCFLPWSFCPLPTMGGQNGPGITIRQSSRVKRDINNTSPISLVLPHLCEAVTSWATTYFKEQFPP